MKKYMVIYRSTTPAAEQMAGGSPEQAKAGMELWMAWAAKAAGSIVDMGSPLAEVRRLGNGSAAGGAHVTGFSILQAQSADALAELMKDHPHQRAPGASIEVLEFMPIPGA